MTVRVLRVDDPTMALRICPEPFPIVWSRNTEVWNCERGEFRAGRLVWEKMRQGQREGVCLGE